MVSNFMADFRSSLIQELTSLLNSSSENNSTRLHSNLDYFREELFGWRNDQDKELRNLHSRVGEFEMSLSSVLQLLDQRGLFNSFDESKKSEPQVVSEVEESPPDYDLRIDVSPEDIQNFENIKKAKKKKKKVRRKSEDDMCNFSSHPTHETNQSHQRSGIIEFNGGDSFEDSTVDIQAELIKRKKKLT